MDEIVHDIVIADAGLQQHICTSVPSVIRLPYLYPVGLAMYNVQHARYRTWMF